MTDVAPLYPWQEPVWQRMASSRGKQHHALLLRGPAGIGKQAFAQNLAKSLLCLHPVENGHACNACASCGWFEQASHPDFRLLSPEQDLPGEDEAPTAKTTGKKSQISVAQVRGLSDFLELTSHSGGARIVLITPAEGLNPASANALLKMLEEPPPAVIFILVSHQPQRLLPTIISRCQQVVMPVPTEAEALQWLQSQDVQDAAYRLAYSGGSPLAALESAGEGNAKLNEAISILKRGSSADAFVLAPLLTALGMAHAITALQKWVYDLLSSRLAHQVRYHLADVAALQELAKSVDLGLLLEFQRKLNDAFRSATHPLNNELQLESLLLQYIQLFSAKTKP